MRYAPIWLLLLFMVACTTATSNPVTETPRTGITPIVTLTAPLDAITATPTMPIRLQARVDCPQTPPTRLIIQDRGRVTDNNDETLNLRSGPGTSFTILTALDPLDQFTVIAGPTCDEGFAWFRVQHNDTIGWVAEGDFEEYYVEPYLTG